LATLTITYIYSGVRDMFASCRVICRECCARTTLLRQHALVGQAKSRYGLQRRLVKFWGNKSVLLTLHALSSIHTGPDPDVSARFAAGEAQRLTEAGALEERLALAAPALPERPGLKIAAQALPWREGPSVSPVFFHRWRGVGMERVCAVVWSVLGRETITTLAVRHEVFHPRLVPADGAFEIEPFVTVARPQVIVRMSCSRTQGAPALIAKLPEFSF
jgi:hypothetical protein